MEVSRSRTAFRLRSRAMQPSRSTAGSAPGANPARLGVCRPDCGGGWTFVPDASSVTRRPQSWQAGPSAPGWMTGGYGVRPCSTPRRPRDAPRSSCIASRVSITRFGSRPVDSPMFAGTICHDTPKRSSGQPQRPSRPPPGSVSLVRVDPLLRLATQHEGDRGVHFNIGPPLMPGAGVSSACPRIPRGIDTVDPVTWIQHSPAELPTGGSDPVALSLRLRSGVRCGGWLLRDASGAGRERVSRRPVQRGPRPPQDPREDPRTMSLCSRAGIQEMRG